MSHDAWNPDQYRQFAGERTQPFFDLLALIRAQAGMVVIDLGCGTGELTAQLHDRLRAASTTGVDTSARMLEKAAAIEKPGLRFQPGDISMLDLPPSGYDLIFSNAALNWVPGHEQLLPRLIAALKPGGQLAVQVPANEDHPAYQAVNEIALLPEFVRHLPDGIRQTPVQSDRWYAERLAQWNTSDQHVRTQIYGHRLESPDAVIDWLKGTVLTYYELRLPKPTYDAFLAALCVRIRQRLGTQRPYFFSFARRLIWAQR